MPNLFSHLPCCTYCQIAPKPSNPVLFNGFLDADTGQLVCWNCRDEHYRHKENSEHRGKYSEMPQLLTHLTNQDHGR
ncbi:hypothetical protein GGE08_001579 [Muricauda sp. ARW1Y1]|jgi:hypothetical protein|nr:hypothetical protein [Muricauda sp. ARW1Y1]